MSPLERFEIYGLRVCPFYNYFQPALVLVELGAIDAGAALRVGADLVIDQAFTPDSLTASYAELARRGQVTQLAATRILQALRSASDAEYAGAGSTLRTFGQELERLHLEPVAAPKKFDVIDYGALLAQERVRVRTAKLRVLRRL
jgi:hypothetical protein